MIRKKADIQETADVETTGEAKVISTISSEGELPCVLIFPDKKHIQNYTFAPILDFIKQTLINTGFKIKLLSDETRDLTRYIDEFTNIAKQCVYGVVILDGFRPNVLLELGILIGLNKPITLLMSENAEISVKTLYQNISETALTERRFNDLKNPKLRLGSSDNHLSDLSTHLTIFDPSANSDEMTHVSKKLKDSIERENSLIIEEFKKVNSKPIAEIMPKYLQKYQKTLFRILQYYTGSTKFSAIDIEKSRKEIENLENESGSWLPSDIRIIIASLYTSLAEKALWGNAEEIREHFSNSLKVYDIALKHEKDRSKKADIQGNAGKIYWKLAQYLDKKENCKKAIKAFKEALKIWTLDRFPMDYAATQNNLGTAYRTLGEVVDKAENCKKSIKAFKEALKIYTLDRFPMEYAATQNNLGTAYGTLGEVEDKVENCKKAIKAYEEALKIRTFDRFPRQYAATQNNLGTAYDTLGEVVDKAENCKKAIKAFKEALKIYTLDRFPMDYAAAQNNLGTAYRTLGEVENKAENCKKAIKAYEEALKVFTKEEVSESHLLVKSNLRELLDFCRGE